MQVRSTSWVKPLLGPFPFQLKMRKAQGYNLQLEIFGGSAAMRDARSLSETGAQSGVIVNALNLADLARILEIEEFEATGTITGALPFEIIDGGTDWHW